MNLPGWLVRRITYPVHERLRGRPTLRELALLRRLASKTPATVQTDVNERLRALLCFAADRLPHYAELFAHYGLDLHAADPIAELRKLPVLDKSTVRTHAAGMIWPEVPGGVHPHASGGTTGDTLHFVIDRQRQAQDLAARLFMQGLFGVQPGARRLHLWGNPIEARGHRLRRWRDWLLNERLLNAFDLSPTRLYEHLRRVRSFRPQVLYGYPTAIALLAEHARRFHRAAEFSWLRLVIVTGEEVTGAQVAEIRQVFGCAVAGEYGNREVGLIAHDCPRGRMHVLTPHVHVDIGANGPSGGGEVLCTTLNARAQPFIRYRVGDMGALDAAPCPCGLPLPTMRLRGGKVTGLIALPDGRLCHGAVTSHVLRDQSGIRAFRTYQHALHDFEVLLVVDDSFRPESVSRIRERYRALFGARINVECRIVDDIPPDPSGKRRYVVSSVSHELASVK